MKYVLLVIAAIIIIRILYKLPEAYKAVGHKYEALKYYLEILLNRGYDKGFLIIRIKSSKKFIQIRKYVNSIDEYGIELGFPKAKWSLEYFKDLEDMCIQNNINYEYVYEEPLDFIYIDFNSNIEYAYNTIKKILIEIFNQNENSRFFIRMDRIAQIKKV